MLLANIFCGIKTKMPLENGANTYFLRGILVLFSFPEINFFSLLQNMCLRHKKKVLLENVTSECFLRSTLFSFSFLEINLLLPATKHILFPEINFSIGVKNIYVITFLTPILKFITIHRPS